MNAAFSPRKARVFAALMTCVLSPSAPLATGRVLTMSAPLVIARTIGSAQNSKDVLVLEPGKPIEQELAEGQTHTYQITLVAGQFLHAVINEHGAKVAATLVAPDGKKLIEVGSPQITQDGKWLSQIVASSGAYGIEVRTVVMGAAPGRYEIKIEEQRQATLQDESRIAAQRAFIEATQLAAQKTAESFRKALEKYTEALKQFQVSGRQLEEAVTLNMIGAVYAQPPVVERQKALGYNGQALAIYRKMKDLYGEGFTLNRMGRIYFVLSQYEKAIDCYQQALALMRSVGYRAGEIIPLQGLGNSYLYQSSRYEKAIEYYEQALTVAREVKDRTGEGATLGNLGIAHYDLSQYEKAIEYYGQALAIAREVKDRTGEGKWLLGLGGTYQSLSQFEKAIEYYEQALPVLRGVKDLANEGNTLNSLGSLYLDLGRYEKALDYYQQALAIARKLKSGEGETLNNLGDANRWLSRYGKAIECYEQALAITKEVQDRAGEGDSLNGLGSVYYSLSQFEKAIAYYERALAIKREIKDRTNEATSLIGLGNAYSSHKQFEKATQYYDQALAIKREIGDRAGEGTALNNLMRAWKQQAKPRVAIFYGKQAVNTYQEIRGSIKGLDKNSRQSFLKAKEKTYRELAELLIAAGRLEEAHQVIDLLKEEEYFDFIRRDGKASTATDKTEYRPEEAKAKEKDDSVTALGRKLAELDAKTQQTPDEERLRGELLKEIESAEQDYQSYLKVLATDIRKPDMSGNKLREVILEEGGLMADLRELGADTVALYTVVSEDKYVVFLMTPETRVAREYPIKSADLSKKIFAFRNALQNPEVDPLPLARELYRILVGPIAKDLEGARSKPDQILTLMWELDGVLRFVPLAALHDGKKYLVERFRNVVYTPASKSRLKDSANAHWKGLGLGVSKAHSVADGEFPALPAVPGELRGIIRDESAEAAGVLPGRVLLDEAFTVDALKGARQGYQLVHIASHFQLKPGDETKSFLLLGDGSLFTLAQLRTSPMMFRGVDLLSLSACNTAIGDVDANGNEIEGFGVMAQQQGAKAVVASLWPVADESTKELMREFYRLRESTEGTSKAEALREAQLALLHGSIKVAQSTQRGLVVKSAEAGKTRNVKFRSNPAAPFAHPYYWAPFILIGNWK